ncbi:hypothetical protein SDC9_197582 [bioreactor metagenome]|uniref:Uncharacterized protein n=1 Tax=bioreactor metagenome TaxID=1076179 RepID=A0A645IF78_9ZZZZ
MKNVLGFHDCKVIVQAVKNRGIPLHPRVQSAHSGTLQKLLRRIHVGLKAEGQLQNRIPRGLFCPFKKLMTERTLDIGPLDDSFRHLAVVCA